MHKFILLLIGLMIFIGGCGTTSKLSTIGIAQENKDVFILSTLISDYMWATKNPRIVNKFKLNLNELIQNDSLGRISNSFKKIELKYQDGITVYFQFSDSRDNNEIELTDKEVAKMKNLKWKMKNSIEQFDGQIQFHYQERFYRIRKIFIKE